MDDDRWIPEEKWTTIVKCVPLVSVDLIVAYDGGILLGLRENEPAKGEWFVPGGTVLKNERLEEAVQRVARTEIGCEIQITDRLGVYEHFYETSEIDGVGSKHYLANAFVVEPTGRVELSDDQHSDLRVVRPPFGDYHPYVEQYLEAWQTESENR